MKVYNSLTNKKEEFIPIDKNVIKMYSCGPTVYYYPHIGNMRAYIFMDSLRRILKYNGYKIEGVINITDVGHLTSDADEGEDKMELSAAKEKKTPYEIAEYYTNIFFDNLKLLNIETPEHVTKATEYIDKMIMFIKELEKKGYTYLIKDGLYFDISKFKGYGKLSNKDNDEIGYGRIEENTEKHNQYDFALWKFVNDNHIMKWDSPWGVGCPGWHIECSAMSTDILGEHIDIHTGGIDHKTIHHENEIAQNDCAMGHSVVNTWMHCNFLLVDGGKMSKSLNNIYTVQELVNRGYSPLDFKYLCLNTHYRKNINFTFEGLDSSRIALNKIRTLLKKHKEATSEFIDLKEYEERFLDAINDDLNVPLGLGILWEVIRLDSNKNIYDLIIKFNKSLGLELDKEMEEESIPEDILKIANERWEAKKNKDFQKSDLLREELKQKGYIVKDNSDSFTIRRD